MRIGFFLLRQPGHLILHNIYVKCFTIYCILHRRNVSELMFDFGLRRNYFTTVLRTHNVDAFLNVSVICS